MTGLAEALAQFGAAGKNPRWSWSGRSPDGETVVINLWKDLLRRENGRWVYDEFAGLAIENDGSWLRRPGARERLENLRWAQEHCDGVFRVIIVVAKDVNADPREIAECYPQRQLRMRITELGESGRFSATQAD